MGIDIVPFEPSDERAALSAYEITRASAEREAPDIPFVPAATFVSKIQRPGPGYAWVHALAHLDGTPVGYVELCMPVLDNPENASLELHVAPESRRRGVGRALHSFAVDQARAAGRKRLSAETVDQVPDGGAFATMLGATPALPETRSRLDLRTADHDRFAAMLAEAWTHAAGYRVVTWLGVPPDEFIDDVAELDSRFISEAPLGSLEWEPEKVDADRVRDSEQNRLDRGLDRIHGGVVHEASGHLVAWTTLSGPVTIERHVWQHITLVHPEHRGHRLGMIVKLENLKHGLARKPRLEAIDTFNATSNEHMLAINRAMGFQAVDSWVQWQETI